MEGGWQDHSRNLANHGQLRQQLGEYDDQSHVAVGEIATGHADSAPSVSLPDVGKITLATLDQLRAKRVQLAADAQALSNQASDLEVDAQGKFADAGAIIVPRQSEANLSPELQAQADKATEFVARITSLDGQLHEIENRPHSGLSGAFARLRDWNAVKRVRSDRDAAASGLRQLLIVIGRGSAHSPIADAGTHVAKATELETEADQLRAAASEKSAEAAAVDSEIQLREISEKEMGFDALYTAAYLSSHGATPVASTLELKRGEEAIFSTRATLSRNQTRARFVGGSQGFSFPIGRTGIRYRVGSFHGQPISQQVLTQLDRGSVVVTNQRLAFVGSVKSVVIPLPKVVHIEVYSDAFAVFHEGRETADYLLVGAPKQVVFYVNWALEQLRD